MSAPGRNPTTQAAVHPGAPGMWRTAAVHPGREAIVDPSGRVVTFGGLAAAADRFGRGLQALGLENGDTVVLLLPNSIEFLELYFAALQTGLYVAPVNWHLTGAEVGYILDNSDAKAFIAHESLAPVATRAIAEAASVNPDGAAARGDLACFAVGEIEGFRPLRELGADEPAGLRPERRTLGGPMLYTSGTTGRPKGVRRPLTGADPDEVSAANQRFFAGFGISDEDHVHICGSPLYHTAVLNFASISLQHGQKVVLMDRWTPRGWLELVGEHGVTQTHMVPTQFSRLLEIPEGERGDYDVSSLRCVVHGAAPCPRHVKERMLAWWGPVLTEYYAGTEGGGCTITGEEWLRKPGSVGMPWPTTTLRILGEDGGELPAGEIGDVYLEMHGSSFEYHRDPAKTADARVGRLFTMGDVGYVDEDGYLFLCDRRGNMIISGGVNIYPAEIESELMRHPAVRDAAVVGVPDEDWGESVRAYVECADGFSGSNGLAGEILDFAADRLAKYKLPREVRFIEEMPRDPNGKLYKRRLP